VCGCRTDIDLKNTEKAVVAQRIDMIPMVATARNKNVDMMQWQAIKATILNRHWALVLSPLGRNPPLAVRVQISSMKDRYNIQKGNVE
jgi:hypothetical protein